jgi:hypothetical protein
MLVSVDGLELIHEVCRDSFELINRNVDLVLLSLHGFFGVNPPLIP